MNERPEETANCVAMQEDLVEFALGTLSGRSRSQVLDHLESCPNCSAELDSMSATADVLLYLAPEAEPPLGFESRLAERLPSIQARRVVSLPRRTAVWAVAAALVATLGFGLGAVTMTHGQSDQTSASDRPTMARLTADGRALGQVFLSSGDPSWMMMTVDSGLKSGMVWCQVTLTNGRTVTIGKFALARGYGSWVARIDEPGSQIRSAKLVDANGTVLASAALTT